MTRRNAGFRAASSTGLRSGNRSKYGNRKTVVDGIEFDSKLEAQRSVTLKLMQRKGELSDLALQVPFELIPKQKKDDGKAERACDYIADFTYRDRFDNFIVEDVKGRRTPEYIIKRKLMLYIHGITIREVTKP